MAGSERNNRIFYFDLLRIFACFGVVLLHAAAQHSEPFLSFDWTVFTAYDSIVRWTVPVFVMVSGALLLDPSRSFIPRVFYKKNLVRLITAYMFWSVIYAVINYFRGERLRTVIGKIITGEIHLWYLFMLAGLYLCLPLLRKIIESEKLTKYFLFLWLVFTVLIKTSRCLLLFYKKFCVDWLDALSSETNISMAIGYSGYFVLGYYLHNRSFTKKIRLLCCFSGFAGAVSTFVLTFLLSSKSGSADYSFFDNFFLGTVLTAIAVFVSFKYGFPQEKICNNYHAVGIISDCTFGIYLAHYAFFKYLDTFVFLQPVKAYPVIYIPLVSIMIFLASLLISFILNKIPFLRKYIV